MYKIFGLNGTWSCSSGLHVGGPNSQSMKQLWILLLPTGWDVIPLRGFPQHFFFEGRGSTHLYSLAERVNVELRFLSVKLQIGVEKQHVNTETNGDLNHQIIYHLIYWRKHLRQLPLHLTAWFITMNITLLMLWSQELSYCIKSR